MPAARTVTVIPPTLDLFTRTPSVAARKRRTAGYARVSTGSDEQFTSYEAQIDYYTKYIQNNPEWEFVRVYTDEGISVSAPGRFCSFSPNRKCRKMAGKGVQPLDNYTCRFCLSSLKQADKSGLDRLQAGKLAGV